MKKVLFFIVVFIVCSYIFNKCDKQKQTQKTEQSSDVQASEPKTRIQQVKDKFNEIVDDVSTSVATEQVVNDGNNVTVKHKNYTTTFSNTLKYPILVEWWMTSAKLCKGERNDEFVVDPQISSSDLYSEYKGCGKMKLDRGHMCPAADNKCDKIWQNECFYFSNIAPQYANLNRGEWKQVEDNTREMSSSYDSIHVWCGSVGVDGKLNSISIPKQCWKLIYIKSKNKYIGYIFDNNNNGDGDISNNEVSKEQIEKLTGYGF